MARRKKKVGRYPGGLILFSMTVALFLIGFCGLLALQSKRLVTYIRENYEVRVFLDRDIDSAKAEPVYKKIVARPYVLTANGQPQVNFVSRDAAAREFIAETKEDFKTFLDDNPLHDSYRIRLAEDYFEEAKLQAVKKDLEAIDGISEAVYQENLVDTINRNINKIYIVMTGFAVVLLLIIVLLMNNTIRLALYSQRMLIRSMQLVGATNGFITRPFLLRGLWQGLLAGLIASGLLVALQQAAVYNLPELAVLQEPVKIAMILGALVVLGMLIGFVSTYQAVHRYLGVSLDELY
ncbi:FtsX-like permease family protein [Rudanella paleaurantiibacter]|uniref:Cell division protein FtsX n=1 Tax=Rudanella paleaurantiibacter TaxID=2614655 RepID=A0A7J5U4C0_9BACT|nr:ABC transporter permease [Rudanella paleaurantiibacter]KAB7732692.1 FtsX-like permease family protein [Rudanella paleaurantiibacter]